MRFDLLNIISPSILLFTTIVIASSTSSNNLGKTRSSIFDKSARCRDIDIPACKGALPYNKTIYPNPHFGDSDEQPLQSHVANFKPLTLTKCNPNIQFFICSAFAPMCPEQIPQAITSCRSVCEDVKRDCEPILLQFEMQWPKILDCDLFPEEKDGPCMRPPEHSSPQQDDTHAHVKDAATTKAPGNLLPDRVQLVRVLPTCPSDMVNLDPTDSNGTCAFRCGQEAMFSKVEKEQSQFWVLLSATLSATTSSFVGLSILIDWGRFRFPERSILYLSLCYLCSSLPYLTRWIFPFEVTSCSRLPSGESFLIQSGHDNVLCMLSFLQNYFFSMAASTWWLTLTFTWSVLYYISQRRLGQDIGRDILLPRISRHLFRYLSASRKWAHEEIQKRASSLHLHAWGVPAMICIAVLITHKVDASELHGVCSVGNSNPITLLMFVLIPRGTFLSVGVLFTVAGFTSMKSEREGFRKRGTDTSRLEKFIFKMGLFSLLYIVPACVALLCDAHHLITLLDWYPNTVGCKQRGGAANCVRPPPPHVAPYFLGTMLNLAAGLSTCVWVLSWKTLTRWWRFLCCSRDFAKRQASYPVAPPMDLHSAHQCRRYSATQVLLGADQPGATTFIHHQCTNYSTTRELPMELPPPPPSISQSSAPTKYYNCSSNCRTANNNAAYMQLRPIPSNDGASEAMVGTSYTDGWKAPS